jgi:hypothetical protein
MNILKETETGSLWSCGLQRSENTNTILSLGQIAMEQIDGTKENLKITKLTKEQFTGNDVKSII